MSTTNIQPLPDVAGRMRYTELGEGEKYRDNVEHGTNRIAAQMGDMDSRDAFTQYCVDMHKQHPRRKIEGFEIRVSWSPDELSVDKEDDIQAALDHTYQLCHEVAPDSVCWLTAHTDGEGHCVHVHAAVCNHDEVTGKALSHGMTHSRVAAINDEISRQENMSVVGPSKQSGKTWFTRKYECTPFERDMGDRIEKARNASDSVDTFRANLERDGVSLVEKTKRDKDGTEHTGWTYKMREPGGRIRRRKAKNLADEFTKESVESYFAEKQKEADTQKEKPAEHQQAPYEEQKESYSLFDSYRVEKQDVEDNLDALSKQTEGNGRLHDMVDDRRRHSDDFLKDVQADVDMARAEFKSAKGYADRMRRQKAPSLYAIRSVFSMCMTREQDPVLRMFDRMMEQMFAQMMFQMIQEELRRQREEAERRLYEARRRMWDVEKRQKAAERAVSDEYAEYPEEAEKTPEKAPEKPVEAKKKQRKKHDASEFDDLYEQYKREKQAEKDTGDFGG